MKPENRVLGIIVVWALVTLSIFFSSCSPKGWGCNGRGKIMTRVRQ